MSERRIVLVHAGICDSRMWDGFELPGATRHELRGFGRTPLPPAGSFSNADDLEAALDGEPAALVGASFGGQVCLEVAARRPELVGDLVLLGAALPDHRWSEEILAYARQEEQLLEQGELRSAAVLNADFWLSDPDPRERVIAMQEHAFKLQSQSEADPVEPDSIELSSVTGRTLVAVGQLDKQDFHQIADRLLRELPDAASTVIEGAGHLPSLERPEQTARLVRRFLGG